MLSIEGQIDVRCSVEAAWDLLCRFDDLARLIPSVEKIEVSGDHVNGRVVVELGRLKVSSRVTLEVTERKPYACLKAVGLSYLGETIQQQIAKKGIKGIDSGSVGRLNLHLDLRESGQPDHVALIYHAEVDARGRLKRIYQSILKNKAPEMIAQFAHNIQVALQSNETQSEPVSDSDSPPIDAEESNNTSSAVDNQHKLEIEPGKQSGDALEQPSSSEAKQPHRDPVAPHDSWWKRFVNWFRRRFRRRRKDDANHLEVHDSRCTPDGDQTGGSDDRHRGPDQGVHADASGDDAR